MADPISGVAHGAISQNLGGEKMQQQSGTGGRSFESVLQGTQGEQTGAQTEGGISGAKLEEIQRDLMRRAGNLPPGTPNVNALLPDFLTTRTRLGMLKEVMSKSNNGAPQVGADLRGRLGGIENEYNQVEGIMKSNQELSMPQLLGLQARLYMLSQHVEVLSKVVDQVTGGIKTILNTNI